MRNNRKSILFSGRSLIILSSILLVMLAGCNRSVKPESLDEMIAKALASADLISVDDFKHLSEHHENFVLIDCREADEYTEGHIPGSMNIPRGTLEFSNRISNRRDFIFIYADNNERGALAAASLKKLKYKHVSLIDGGMEGWLNSYPELIETGPEATGQAAPVEVEEESGGCGG
ncbi:MAG: hypothetical protein KAT48_05340 [Bacteroidales bacterium]|nr:hypothetical protein [Bacteroidales bacterium]